MAAGSWSRSECGRARNWSSWSAGVTRLRSATAARASACHSSARAVSPSPRRLATQGPSRAAAAGSAGRTSSSGVALRTNHAWAAPTPGPEITARPQSSRTLPRHTRCGAQLDGCLVVERLDLARHEFDAEAVVDQIVASLGKHVREWVVRQQPIDRARQRLAVARRDEQSADAVFDHLGAVSYTHLTL